MEDPASIQTLLLLLLTVVLVLLNGFFVATEFAIVKIRSTRIKELVEDGSVPAKHVSNALKQLDAFLSATQLGITLASLGIGWVGEPVVAGSIVRPAFALFGMAKSPLVTPIALALAFVVITFAHIVFGELAPKWMAIQRTEGVALWVARPMTFFMWCFKPFIYVINSAARAALGAIGIKPVSGHDMVHSEEELRMIITASGSENGGTIRETQAELLDNVFDFGHRLARQVMVHRMEIFALDVENSLEENIRLAQEGNHTRFPAVDGDIDNVIGFIHTKDLFALYQRDPHGDMRTIIRDILLVPESIRIDLLLRQMQRNRQHMAVLVDEYGGTAGLATVADLLEELVGELPDEFEPAEEEWITRLDHNSWSVDGRVPLEDLEEALRQEISCEESCDTVGGFAFWAFGRIPEMGDAVETNELTLRILAMDGRRVSRVQINVKPLESDDERVANAAHHHVG